MGAMSDIHATLTEIVEDAYQDGETGRAVDRILAALAPLLDGPATTTPTQLYRRRVSERGSAWTEACRAQLVDPDVAVVLEPLPGGSGDNANVRLPDGRRVGTHGWMPSLFEPMPAAPTEATITRPTTPRRPATMTTHPMTDAVRAAMGAGQLAPDAGLVLAAFNADEERRERMEAAEIKATAESIERVAHAIATSTLVGPRHAAAARLRSMTETLAILVGDDRS